MLWKCSVYSPSILEIASCARFCGVTVIPVVLARAAVIAAAPGVNAVTSALPVSIATCVQGPAGALNAEHARAPLRAVLVPEAIVEGNCKAFRVIPDA